MAHGGCRANWVVQYRKPGAPTWAASTPKFAVVNARGTDSHRVHQAKLGGLEPGSEVDYRVRKDDAVFFEARGRTRKSVGQDHRFVVFGDCAADTVEQR